MQIKIRRRKGGSRAQGPGGSARQALCPLLVESGGVALWVLIVTVHMEGATQEGPPQTGVQRFYWDPLTETWWIA